MESLIKIWDSLSQFHNEIIAIPFTLLTTLIIYLLKPKVKIIWGQTNNSFHILKPVSTKENPNPVNVSVFTDKMYIQNIGKAPATNIEIVYQGKPDEFSIYPKREFSELTNPDGSLIVKMMNLAPKNIIIIDSIYLSGNQSKITSINCKETIPKEVKFQVLRKYGKTVETIVAIFMLAGLIFLISLIINLLTN